MLKRAVVGSESVHIRGICLRGRTPRFLRMDTVRVAHQDGVYQTRGEQRMGVFCLQRVNARVQPTASDRVLHPGVGPCRVSVSTVGPPVVMMQGQDWEQRDHARTRMEAFPADASPAFLGVS